MKKTEKIVENKLSKLYTKYIDVDVELASWLAGILAACAFLLLVIL